MTYCLFSAPVGNPLNPEIINQGFFISPASYINFRIGYEGDFVYDARMDKKPVGKIDNFKKDSNSALITINWKNRIDTFATLGSCRIRSDWRFNASNATSRLELESNYKFYWSAGGKIILLQWGNAAAAIGGRYSHTKPPISFITIDGSPVNFDKYNLKYHDWQIDFGLAYKIDVFIPYVGTKYLNAKSKLCNTDIVINDNNQQSIKMKNKDHFGLYTGCTLSNIKYFMLSVEARFIDEEAIAVIGEIKF